MSFRVKQPSLDLGYLGSLLGLMPIRVWKSGERRSTPKETPLDGTYEESYWCARITNEREKSEKCSLEEKLVEWTARLGAHQSEFNRLLRDGGKIEYFVWIYCERNMGFELNPELLTDIAELGLTLSIVCDP